MKLHSAAAVLTAMVVYCAPLSAQSLDGLTKLYSVAGADVLDVALSPDNRWLVYSRPESEQISHLWAQRVSGGNPIRLTSGNSFNARPMFTPSGARIIYTSNFPRREGDTKSYLVALPFSSRDGRVTGMPRQLSLDGIKATSPFEEAAISPDGKWIAYVECCDASRLRLIPSTGGNAQTLATGYDRFHRFIVWSDDASAVFFLKVHPSGAPSKIMRVSRRAGSPVEIRSVAARSVSLTQGGHYLIGAVSSGSGSTTLVNLMDLDGRVLREIQLPNGFVMRAFSADRKYLLGIVREQRAVIKVAPIAGGGTRQLTSNDSYDWPQSWGLDNTIYYVTGIGYRALSGVTIDGKTRTAQTLPAARDVRSWKSVVNGYAIYTRAASEPSEHQIIARKLNSGEEIEITSAGYGGTTIRGAGGTYSTDGNAYIYQERAGNSLQLRSVVPGSPSKLLKTFPMRNSALRAVAVTQGRVAYTESIGDSVRVMVSRGPQSVDVIVLTAPGRGPGEIEWSRDGKHIAFAARNSTDLHLIELTAAGTLAGAPQKYTLPFEYFYETSLLNGGRGATMIAQPKDAPNAVVAFVSFDDPSHPVLLSRADGSSAWGHLLSPDNRWVAYAAELPPKGTTIWKLDVTKILNASTAPKR